MRAISMLLGRLACHLALSAWVMGLARLSRELPAWGVVEPMNARTTIELPTEEDGLSGL